MVAPRDAAGLGAAGLGAAGLGAAVAVHVQGRAGKAMAAVVAEAQSSSKAVEESNVGSHGSWDSMWISGAAQSSKWRGSGRGKGARSRLHIISKEVPVA